MHRVAHRQQRQQQSSQPMTTLFGSLVKAREPAVVRHDRPMSPPYQQQQQLQRLPAGATLFLARTSVNAKRPRNCCMCTA